MFSPHNFMSDPPFSHMDLIACRNVLIYLQRSLQPDIIGLFHYALRRSGVLLVGSAESVTQSHLFKALNKARGLYGKLNVPAPFPARVAVAMRTRAETRHESRTKRFTIRW